MTTSLTTVQMQSAERWDTTIVSTGIAVISSLYKTTTTSPWITYNAVAVPCHHAATTQHTTVDILKMYT